MDIVTWPDPRLQQASLPVAEVDDEVRRLVETLTEAMYAAPACLLAAPQLGVMRRVMVVDTATKDEPSDLRVFINPEVYPEVGATWRTFDESCLSIPGRSVQLERWDRVVVRSLTLDGRQDVTYVWAGAEGPNDNRHTALAMALQHGLDLLDGVIGERFGMFHHLFTRNSMKIQAWANRQWWYAQAGLTPPATPMTPDGLVDYDEFWRGDEG